MTKTNTLRELLGDLPFTAEIDWMLRSKNRARKDHYNLSRLQTSLPAAVESVKPFAEKAKPGKKVLFFSTLHYWIEQSAFLSLALAGLGHDVTLLTLPYSEWHKVKDKFTQRQRILHTKDALASLTPLVNHASMLDSSTGSERRLKPAADLPASLYADIEEVSLWDAQYTLMREEVDMSDPSDRALYDLRIERNTFAAKAALEWMQVNKPDVVLIPNGLILEMGIVFRVARHLGIDAVTYEFNDQREQIWIAQNSSIMRQETDYLVEARCSQPMTDEMFERVADLENARRGARVWGKSKRLWQYVSSQGAESTRKTLGLDDRPVVMLAANVLGDSLTLGRDIFAASMTEWITKTVQYFAKRTDVQLVIRVHPGEKLVPQAKSMGTVVKEALPEIPSHIHVIGALDPVNTYDLIEIADVGLAYTTTVGLETAMNGRPVISCGQTHYRGRGITLDPNTWDEYYAMLEKILSDVPAHQMNEKQIEFAWNYAYRFFFEYPRPFPWRLMNFWDDLEIWTLDKVLSDEGMAQFKDTFGFLVGEPFAWK
ncbi:MAG: capsular biosynthesis protein [Anaerolineales bacterium]|nr:capsular biosynthesis protein [Anaerolineales bacterium]